MKKTFLFITILTIGLTKISAQKINWVTFNEALALQQENPKKILIDMYTNWCGPCKMLDKNTFHNKDVANYINKNFYAVKFNAEGNETVTYKGNSYTNPNYDPAKANRRNSAHQISRVFKIRAYPTIVYLDENANLIAPISGYQTPAQIELYLKLFATNDYKDLKSQEEFNTYYRAFKPTFN